MTDSVSDPKTTQTCAGAYRGGENVFLSRVSVRLSKGVNCKNFRA